jgi:hypothetical protein
MQSATTAPLTRMPAPNPWLAEGHEGQLYVRATRGDGSDSSANAGLRGGGAYAEVRGQFVGWERCVPKGKCRPDAAVRWTIGKPRDMKRRGP